MGRTACKFAVVLLLSSAVLAGCFPRAREEARDPADLLRAAVDNTLALKSVRVVEETAFPSSEKLLSAREARALGTGIWTRVVEFVAPDRVHYSSSSEDGGIEAYRVGSSMAYRLIDLEAPADELGEAGSGGWVRLERAADVRNEAVRSELEWLSGVTGVESIIDGGLREVENVTKTGEEDVERVRCAVLSFESPSWLKRFEANLAEAGVEGKPVKYEIKAWVTLRGDALIYKIEDMWVYQEPGSGVYEYTISTRVIEPAPGLRIELP
ncbi:MAG: hypothetical protein PWR07_510 [Bacillota bacterium]|nr:hypothetical protein [Bacillota bacterium]